MQIGLTFNDGGLKLRRTTLYFSSAPQNASIGLAGEPKIRRATLNPEPNHKLRCRREGSDLRNRSVVVVRVRPSVRSAAPFHVTRDVRAAVPRRVADSRSGRDRRSLPTRAKEFLLRRCSRGPGRHCHWDSARRPSISTNQPKEGGRKCALSKLCSVVVHQNFIAHQNLISTLTRGSSLEPRQYTSLDG